MLGSAIKGVKNARELRETVGFRPQEPGRVLEIAPLRRGYASRRARGRNKVSARAF